MRRPVLVIIFILLISIPLALVLHEFTREVILSLLMRISWYVRLYMNSLPQPILWVVFIAIASFIAARSLLKRRSTPEVTSEATRLRMGRVLNLMQAINRTSEGLYFKWRLAQHLLSLTVNTLAYQERTTPNLIKERLKSGGLDAPSEIEDYLLAGLTPVLSTPTNLVTRLRQAIMPTHRISPLDLDPEKVIQFLEDQLEIDHE
jgi:hypothetical protein